MRHSAPCALHYCLRLGERLTRGGGVSAPARDDCCWRLAFGLRAPVAVLVAELAAAIVPPGAFAAEDGPLFGAASSPAPAPGAVPLSALLIFIFNMFV